MSFVVYICDRKANTIYYIKIYSRQYGFQLQLKVQIMIQINQKTLNGQKPIQIWEIKQNPIYKTQQSDRFQSIILLIDKKSTSMYQNISRIKRKKEKLKEKKGKPRETDKPTIKTEIKGTMTEKHFAYMLKYTMKRIPENIQF